MSVKELALRMLELDSILKQKYKPNEPVDKNDPIYKELVECRKKVNLQEREPGKQEVFNKPTAKRIKPKHGEPLYLTKYKNFAKENPELDKFRYALGHISLSKALDIVTTYHLSVYPVFKYKLESIKRSQPDCYGVTKTALLSNYFNRAPSAFYSKQRIEKAGYKLYKEDHSWDEVHKGDRYILGQDDHLRVKTMRNFSNDIKTFEPVQLSIINFAVQKKCWEEAKK